MDELIKILKDRIDNSIALLSNSHFWLVVLLIVLIVVIGFWIFGDD